MKYLFWLVCLLPVFASADNMAYKAIQSMPRLIDNNACESLMTDAPAFKECFQPYVELARCKWLANKYVRRNDLTEEQYETNFVGYVNRCLDNQQTQDDFQEIK